MHVSASRYDIITPMSCLKWECCHHSMYQSIEQVQILKCPNEPAFGFFRTTSSAECLVLHHKQAQQRQSSMSSEEQRRAGVENIIWMPIASDDKLVSRWTCPRTSSTECVMVLCHERTSDLYMVQLHRNRLSVNQFFTYSHASHVRRTNKMVWNEITRHSMFCHNTNHNISAYDDDDECEKTNQNSYTKNWKIHLFNIHNSIKRDYASTDGTRRRIIHAASAMRNVVFRFVLFSFRFHFTITVVFIPIWTNRKRISNAMKRSMISSRMEWNERPAAQFGR